MRDPAFPHYGYRSSLARLLPDGSLDDSFRPAFNDRRGILQAVVLPDQRLAVEYSPLDSAAGVHRGSLWIRLLPDGALDPTYQPPQEANLARHDVTAVAPDGAVLIAGYETSADASQWTNPFVRLQSDGRLDEAFHPTIRPAQIVGFLPDGNILAVEDAEPRRTEQGVEASLLELNPAGQQVGETVFLLPDDWVFPFAFHQLPTGDLLLYAARHAIVYSRDGSFLKSLSVNVSHAVTPPAPVAFPDGALLFGHASSRPRNYTVPSLGPVLLEPTGLTNPLANLFLRQLTNSHPLRGPDGRIYLGVSGVRAEVGRDGSLRPVTLVNWEGLQGEMQSDHSRIWGSHYVSRTPANGESGSPWKNPQNHADTENSTRGVAVLRDDRVLAWGQFSALAGWFSPGVGRLHANLEADRGFVSRLRPGTLITHAHGQPDGRMLVAELTKLGMFGIHETNLLYRLNADGSLDPSFREPVAFDGQVRSLGLDQQGRILVGGTFRQVAGRPAASVARLHHDGSPDESFTRGIGADQPVERLYPMPDDSVVAYGNFRWFDGQEAWGLVRLTGGPPTAGPPRILGLSESRSVPVGSPVALGAIVNGSGPRAGQWHFNGLPLPGETNASLVLKAPTIEDSGSYSFSVVNQHGATTASTQLTVAASTPATLRLALLPPRAGSDRRPGFALSGPPGRSYYIQVSTNLVAWKNIGNLAAWHESWFSGVRGNFSVRYTDPYPGQEVPRFYRAVPWSPP